MTVYISNAISIGMFPVDQSVDVRIKPARIEYIQELFDQVEVISAVGHASTAAVISDQIGYIVESNRINVELTIDDCLIVAQYVGPRLPEGATTLPDGAEIRYFVVMLV